MRERISSAGWAAWIRPAAVAQVPHTLFHLAHLEGLSIVDVIGQTARQLVLVGLALAVGFSLSVRSRTSR
jgi:hypothetical protein